MLKLIILTSLLALINGLPQNGYNYQHQQHLPSPIPAKSFINTGPIFSAPGLCCQELALLRSQGRILNLNSANSIHSAEKGYFETQSSIGGQSVNGHLVVQQSGNKYSEPNVHATTKPKETILLISQRPQIQTGFKPSLPGPSAPPYVLPNSNEHSASVIQQSSVNVVKQNSASSNSLGISESSKGYSSNNGNQFVSKSQSLNSYGEAIGSDGYVSNSLSGAASDRYATTAQLDSGYSYNAASSINGIEGSGSSTSSRAGFLSNIGGIGGPLSAGGTNVEKHIYVHVPPEDISEAAESHQHRQLQQLLQPKKHYKIVFIKAPTTSSASSNYAQLLAAQGGVSQEKTLIYVLSKKPDEPSIEEIQKAMQQASGSHVTKPEVYFIKYKNRKQQQLYGNGNGNLPGSDFGLDVRNAGSTLSENSYSPLSSDLNELSSQLGPSSPSPVYGAPPATPAPIYGLPNVK